MLTRRTALLGSAAAATLGSCRSGAAQSTAVSVSKAPGCECCEGWAKHLREHGYSVTVTEVVELNTLKAKLGVPADLRSCHTARVENYVLEGHVPALALKHLLEERPQNITGLAVPGMPVGSPGMEVPGVASDVYPVMIFGPSGRKEWRRFKGATPI